MDAQKSQKIASRRFQNGNYLLSLKKYSQARTEYEVALTLYEKIDAHKETAEALNNIGMTLLKDGMADQAKGFFERSYAVKKAHATATRESMFNTLYNLLSISGVMTPDEFESYFLEMKALGDALGGEYVGIVDQERQVYDAIVAQRAAELKKQQEESLARSSPAGALEHIVTAGLPVVVRVEFAVRGLAVDMPEPITYLDQKKLIRVERLSAAPGPAGASTVGVVEFETASDSVRPLMESPPGGGTLQGDAMPRDGAAADGGGATPEGAGPLGEETFGHVRKLFSALALAREDISVGLSHRGFNVGLVSLKNAFGEPMEIYRAPPAEPEAPIALTSEDAMMLNVMLSSEPPAYRLLLMNARRLLDEEGFELALVNAVAGLDVFLNRLLRSSFNSDRMLDYTSVEDCSLFDRLHYLKLLLADLKSGDQVGVFLEPYLGEVGPAVDEAVAGYERIVAGEAVGAEEAEKGVKAIERCVYELKSKYGI